MIDCYDVDKALIGSDDMDYMGRCIINIEDAAYIAIDPEKDAANDNKPPEPKWHDFYYSQGGAAAGKVLLSFIIAPDFDYNWQIQDAENI